MHERNKMDDDSNFIPRSPRMVNFDFRVTKKVENNSDYMVVKADTDVIVLEFKLALKYKIMDMLQIECKSLRDELYENLVTNLHRVVQERSFIYLQHNFNCRFLTTTL